MSAISHPSLFNCDEAIKYMNLYSLKKQKEIPSFEAEFVHWILMLFEAGMDLYDAGIDSMAHRPHYHLRLIKLEKGFQKSKDFTIEKATLIFDRHICLMAEYSIRFDSCFKGISLLGRAVRYGCPALVGSLVKFANIEFGGSSRSPLGWMISSSYSEQCIDILIKKGANPNYENIVDGNTPLFYLCDLGLTREIELLVKSKADIEHQIPPYPRSPGPNYTLINDTVLTYAAKKSSISTLKKIIELGVDLFKTATDYSDWFLQPNVRPKIRSAVFYAINQKSIQNADYLNRAMFAFIKNARFSLSESIPKVLVDIVIEYLVPSQILMTLEPKIK